MRVLAAAAAAVAVDIFVIVMLLHYCMATTKGLVWCYKRERERERELTGSCWLVAGSIEGCI